MSKDTDFPAFPIHGVCTAYQFTGLTARDYFAAKALQGMLCQEFSAATNADLSILASQAFNVADAMLKAREA